MTWRKKIDELEDKARGLKQYLEDELGEFYYSKRDNVFLFSEEAEKLLLYNLSFMFMLSLLYL